MGNLYIHSSLTCLFCLKLYVSEEETSSLCTLLAWSPISKRKLFHETY